MVRRKKEQIEEDNKNNIERIQNMNSIEDMLWWKDLYDPNNIFTVESINRDKVEKLEWGAKADVLFSFLGIYVIGLYVYYPKEYLRTPYQIHISDSGKYNFKGSIYSLKNIKRINEIADCKKLNDNEFLNNFIKKYFSIGNVIPIWPGGNTDRGKAGVFDIINIYCNKDDNAYWMKNLVERYNNTFLEFVFNEEEEFEINKNIVKLRYCSTPEFLDSFENLNEKEDRIRLYNLWLKKIVNVIEDREKKLMDWIEQNKDRVEKL